MPSVANTDIDIATAALILIGAAPITSFTETSTEALVASNIYEDVIRSALCASRWRFAANQQELNRLSDAPTGRFDLAYQLPSDLLMLHALTVNNNIIEYNVYGNLAFTNGSITDKVIADYSIRVGEEKFPSYFILAVEYALASAFAVSIARDDGLASVLESKAQQLMQQARTLDSQQQTTRKLSTSRFITERRS
tara:strand:+ start:140 stop:724 length:585 start_codon:yes stop_codon:yes gene_type:complete